MITVFQFVDCNMQVFNKQEGYEQEKGSGGNKKTAGTTACVKGQEVDSPEAEEVEKD